MNKYYIFETTKSNLINVLNSLTEKEKSFLVVDINNVRWNNPKSKCVLKTKAYSDNIPAFLKGVKSYSQEEILKELSIASWTFKI